MKKFSCLFYAFALVLCLGACGQNTQGKWQEQYDLGVRYLAEGNYEEAIIAFTAAIEIDSKHPGAFIGRGDSYIGSGETEENLAAALADYEEAIALDETLTDAWLGLADVYIRQGDYDKALEVLREALEKTGNDQSIAEKLEEMESGSFSDSAGHVRRMNSYDGDGNLIWYHTYTYNEQGQEASVTSFDGSGNQTGHVDKAYTEDGASLVEYWFVADTGEIAKTVYEYDDAGNAVKEFHYSLNGEIRSIHQKEFDGNGNMIREEICTPEGDVQSYSTYTYDGAGREIRMDSFNAYDGTLNSYMTWEYWDNGHQCCSYNADGTMWSRNVTRYDDEGNYLGYDEYDGAGNLIQSTVNES